MSTAVERSTFTVALIGNPNTGKSTLFSALVGIHQHVGNYPGATVEKRCGRMELAGRRFAMIDLPGLYSLAARSRDEMIAVEVLLGRQHEVGLIDAVLCVIDASNLERHLYLLGQVLELGLPTVVAVNMIDIAAKRGITFDLAALQSRLGVPVVAMQANRGVGLSDVKNALAKVVDERPTGAKPTFPGALEAEVTELQAFLAKHGCQADCVAASDSAAASDGALSPDIPAATRGTRISSALVRRLLFDTSGWFQKAILPKADEQFFAPLQAARKRLEAGGLRIPSVETSVRFDWARTVLQDIVKHPETAKATSTDRIDRYLTHRVFGTVVFGVLMLIVFQAVFVWAQPAMKAIGGGFSMFGDWIGAHMAEGALRSLVVDGAVAGVGSVITFLPQILILFFFIALLEDCGYMARAAFLMDKLMSRAGLSGRSFIPMLSSVACAVPGILSARVIENERDRLATILVAPLMTCSARLPVYALLIAAFVPPITYLKIHVHLFGLRSYEVLGLQGLTLAGLYLFGIVMALAVAMVLKRTILRGETPPFVMELPSYKWPSAKTVCIRVTQRAWDFIKAAGSMILAVTILVWAAAYYPHNPKVVASLEPEHTRLAGELDKLPEIDTDGRQKINDELKENENAAAALYQRDSYLGRAGRAIEPVVKPLGWDWRIGCAVIASFPAREVVVATLGVIYGVGKIDPEEKDDRERLQSQLQKATWDDTGRPVFTIPVALSVMVFFALCAQCAATLAVIQRETNSWRWPAFTFGYMTTLAYVAAFVTYQVGIWLGG